MVIFDIDSLKFDELLHLKKHCNETYLSLPTSGEQKQYGVTATFQPQETFDVLMNRKGHVRKNNLTLIMHSKSNGVMMRYDVIGAEHNGIPTPHLHIFDSKHNHGRTVISGVKLSRMGLAVDSQDSLIDSIAKFLTYNQVELTEVVINGTTF